VCAKRTEPRAWNTFPMASSSGREQEVVSAGAVVLGRGGEVLLVHRPKYDDWSFPKGKLDRGEHRTAAAVREVEEETGLRVRLGVPLADQTYPIRTGTKRVHYWIGRAVGDGDVSGYAPNAEIDEVGWLPIDKARRRLTYEFDVATLGEALERPRKTRTLVVLRHSQARSRKAWRSDDRDRPLLATGRHQAAKLDPVLAAYDVRRLLSSSSLRCVQTLDSYAAASGQELRTDHLLSEEDATRRGVRRLVTGLVDDLGERPASAGGLVLCTHRPVLPWVFTAVGIADPGLSPGEMVVLHLGKGRVRAAERHRIG
jgi:8-oxo-dGTP pyrophosphatase MutT (NUDIX family)/phosphohistidine phosphatase SixA